MIGSGFRGVPGHVLAATAFLLPTIATAAPKGIAPLIGVAALGALALGGWRDLPRLDTFRVLASLVILLGVVGLCSAFWSVIPAHSLSTALRFLGVAASGLVLIATACAIGERERDWVRRGLLWGFALSIAVLAAAAVVQRIGIYRATSPDEVERWMLHFNRFDRSSTTAVLTFWPLMQALAEERRFRLALVLALATLMAVFLLNSEAAMLSLLVALAIWPCALRLPRVSAGVIGAGVIALVAILPSLNLGLSFIARVHEQFPWLKISAIHRLAIWHFAIDRINERPLLGWGMDASRAVPNAADVIVAPGLGDLQAALKTWLPLHPHNAALQWRLELGLPGAILASLIVLWPLWRLGTSRRLPRLHQACGVALIGGALVVAFLSYGIWQEWWMSELWILAALMVAQITIGPLSAESR